MRQVPVRMLPHWSKQEGMRAWARAVSIGGEEGWQGLWGCAGVGGEESRDAGGLTEGGRR